jgi:hypothetical protein
MFSTPEEALRFLDELVAKMELTRMEHYRAQQAVAQLLAQLGRSDSRPG